QYLSALAKPDSDAGLSFVAEASEPLLSQRDAALLSFQRGHDGQRQLPRRDKRSLRLSNSRRDEQSLPARTECSKGDQRHSRRGEQYGRGERESARLQSQESIDLWAGRLADRQHRQRRH